MGLLSLDPSLLQPYQQGLVQAGFTSSDARMGTHVEIVVTDDPEKAWAEFGPHVLYRWRSLNKYMFEGTDYEAEAEKNPFPYFQTESIRERAMIGTAEEIVAKLQALMGDLPVTDLYAFCDFPGLSDSSPTGTSHSSSRRSFRSSTSPRYLLRPETEPSAVASSETFAGAEGRHVAVSVLE